MAKKEVSSKTPPSSGKPRRTAADTGGEAQEAYRLPGLPGYALIPGDPNRIRLMVSQWDPGAKEYEFSRRYAGAIGRYKDVPISAFSTGIGAPSTEWVLNGLAANKVHTFIRVGTTGTLQKNIKTGDLIINDAAVRMDGTSNLYVRPEYPAAASYEVTLALIQAAENLGFRYHLGVGYTAGSFFTGQCRTLYNGYRPAALDAEFSDMQQARVLNFEMEAAAVFTLARLLGARSGMCAAVVAHRITGEWDSGGEGEKKACLAAAEAVRIISGWDLKKKKAKKAYYFPGLENLK
ncbi:MAG: nucleoside phosphorylase [Spirochaetales bacterium]|jgi:uridine phosphorylase|nr:nucleoside phosphorylase [Spirochaetales bacterium]